MKKVMLISLLVILIGAAVVGFIQYSGKETVTVTKQKTATTNENQVEEVPFIEIQEENTEPIEEELPNDMTEEKVQNVIHQMSHQKVKAEKKWGFTPLTQDRVNRLIDVVNTNSYKHKGVYLEILTRWKGNNFSHAATDHNAIWSLQGGTIGRATGVLTIEQEEQFIQEHYSIKQD